MTLRLRLTILLFMLVGLCRADMAPSQDLLPTNTLAVLSIPEVSAAKLAWLASNPGRLWQDPAMAAFRNQFENSIRQKWLTVLERESGLELRELLDLTRGQATLAVFPPLPAEPGSEDSGANWLLLLDTRTGSAALSKALDAARARVGTNTPLTAKTREVGDLRFTTVTLDLQMTAAAGGKPPSAPGEALEDEDFRWELCYGQVGSAFVAGPSWAAISNALPRLTSTNASPGLGSKASFGR